MRYSDTTKSFYPEDIEYPNLPEDIVYVTDQDWQSVITARSLNNQVVFNGTEFIITDAIENIQFVKDVSINTMDRVAGEARQRFITFAPGQELTYQEKAEQAADFAAANYPSGQIANYPFIQVEVTVTGLSPQAAADGILARRTLWIQKGALIEEARLIGKRDVNAATDVAGINTALDTAITALNSIS